MMTMKGRRNARAVERAIAKMELMIRAMGRLLG
jgi:hypothetical protein